MNKPEPTDPLVIEVFIAEPIVERLVVEADGDLAEEVEARQELLDSLTGWSSQRP